MLELVGSETEVPLVTGGTARYVNLDYAASTPPLRDVQRAVDEFLPWYSSVHRGAGFKSLISTQLYEAARGAVASFVGARPDDVVVFTRNTTDAINLLARSLPDDVDVFTFATEHHANLLPWRFRGATVLPVPASAAAAVDMVGDALRRRRPRRGALVAVTGASNVTGELWPIGQIAQVAAAAGARVFLDAAQLVAHSPVDMAAWGVDYLAMSGHKLYAPYGAGALVGRADWLSTGEPFLLGGGAVTFVTPDEVMWREPPERNEAGSPNVVGIVALAAACRTLAAEGMEDIAKRERLLVMAAERRLASSDSVVRYTTWPADHDRIGVFTFNVRGYHHAQVAAVLSAEHGIAVRDGCFCAHPLMLHLLDVDEATAAAVREDLRAGLHMRVPGAVRVSFGLTTTDRDVDLLVDALDHLATAGPRWTYRSRPEVGVFEPDPDPRPWPQLAHCLAESVMN